MKKNIKYLVKEIIPITIGILIALFINNWNEHQKDKKYLNKILTSINEELAETSSSIAKSKLRHQTLIDTLDANLLDDKIPLLQIVSLGGGISMPSIKTNSWKAISGSKIELLDYDFVSSLANIEEGKEILKSQAENAMNFILTNAEETSKYKKMVLKIMIMDMIDNVTDIEKEIEKIDKQKSL